MRFHAKFRPCAGVLLLIGLCPRALPQALTRTLVPGRPLVANLEPGAVDRYLVQASAHQLVTITIEQIEADVVLQLVGPAGEVLAERQDRGGDLRRLRIFHVVSADGDYRVEVSSRTKEKKTGKYRVELLDPHEATNDDRRREEASNLFAESSRIRAQHSGPALQTALEKLASARATWHELDEAYEEAEALRDLSEIEGEIGEWRAMLGYAEAELALRQLLSDRVGRANALNNVGVCHNFLGRPEDGVRYLSEAIELFRDLGDRKDLAIATANLAYSYSLSGDPYRSLRVCEQLLPLRKELGQKAGQAATLNCIAHGHSSLGESEKSVVDFEQAITLFHEAGDRRGEAVALGNLGLVWHELGDHSRAYPNLQRALEIGREIGDLSMVAHSFTRLSEHYLSRGDSTRAMEFGLEGLRGCRNVREAACEAKALRVLSSACRKTGDFERAADYARQAATTARAAADVVAEYEALEIIADIQKQEGKLDLARATLEDALSRVESLRRSIVRPDLRASYFAEVHRIYDFDIGVLMAMHAEHLEGRLNQAAFEQSERARARTLVDWLSGTSEDSLRTASVSVHDAQTLLGPDTVLLEYFLGEDHSFGWAITSDFVSSFSLPKASELTAAAQSAHAWLSTSGVKGSEAQLERLSRILLDPVAAQLGKRRVAIVADGALQFLPFGALPAPGTKGRSMLADHEIVSLPSASVLDALRRGAAHRKPVSKLLAVVADPVFQGNDARLLNPSSESTRGAASLESEAADVERSAHDAGLTRLERLPGTRHEGDAILGMARDQTTFHAFGFDATRDVVLSPELRDYRILHLATHALVDNRNPELTGLVFSLVDRKGNPRNGFLKVTEIYDAKFSADLAVLSACQTALGKEVRGEGLLGLARAFMIGGTPRVVGTLWQVPDAASAEMMKLFYKGMLMNGLPPAAALRSAQLTMRKQPKWSAPYYWAGFVLIGDWT